MSQKKEQTKKTAASAKRRTSSTGRKGSGSAPAKKSGSAKAGTAKKAPAVKTKRLSNEIKGIIVIALGVFLALAFFTGATGVVGAAVKNVVGGLFGAARYVSCIFVIWTGINFFLDKRKEGNAYKYWLLLGMMLFSGVLAALIHGDTEMDYDGVWDAVSEMYIFGSDGFSGGVLGGGLCKLLAGLIGVSGTWVVSIAVMLILVILLTGVSLERLFTKFFLMLKRHSEQLTESARQEVPAAAEPSVAAGVCIPPPCGAPVLISPAQPPWFQAMERPVVVLLG